MSDSRIECGQSDALVEMITRRLSEMHGQTATLHDAGANLLLPVRDVVRHCVDGLRAHGLSDKVIGDALTPPDRVKLRVVHHHNITPLCFSLQLHKDGMWQSLKPFGVGIYDAHQDAERAGGQWARTMQIAFEFEMPLIIKGAK